MQIQWLLRGSVIFETSSHGFMFSIKCRTLIKSNRNNKTIKEKNSYKKNRWILWLRNPNHRQSPPLLDAQPSVSPHVAPSGQSRVSASFDLSSKQWLSLRQKSAKWSFAQRKKEVGIIEKVSGFEVLCIITFHRNTSASNPQSSAVPLRFRPVEEWRNAKQSTTTSQDLYKGWWTVHHDPHDPQFSARFW